MLKYPLNFISAIVSKSKETLEEKYTRKEILEAFNVTTVEDLAEKLRKEIESDFYEYGNLVINRIYFDYIYDLHDKRVALFVELDREFAEWYKNKYGEYPTDVITNMIANRHEIDHKFIHVYIEPERDEK